MLKVPARRRSYGARREIRHAALRMAQAISAEHPDLRVDVDMQSVDGEDAFLWIHVPHGIRPASLAPFVQRMARHQARTTGYWIVPRIVSVEFDARPVFRLRPRQFETPRPVIL